MRLTLGHDGDVNSRPRHSTFSVRRCVRSGERAPASTDVWLRHKTTVRARYDAELKRIVADPALFDSIFLERARRSL